MAEVVRINVSKETSKQFKKLSAYIESVIDAAKGSVMLDSNELLTLIEAQKRLVETIKIEF